MSHTQTIQEIYDAFQRGDLPAILARVTDDVDWNNQGVASRECPWNGDFSSKAGLPGFFQALDQCLAFRVFMPRAFVEQGDRVLVELRIESNVKQNGRPLENDVIHAWSFDGDKVSRYRHYNDTAAELTAWQG